VKVKLEAFNDVMMNDKCNYSSMLNWLKETLSKLSSSHGNILLFDALTGLRPDEASKAIALIHEQENNYIRKDLMILERYKFPELRVSNKNSLTCFKVGRPNQFLQSIILDQVSIMKGSGIR
jgi:hypothetical protein